MIGGAAFGGKSAAPGKGGAASGGESARSEKGSAASEGDSARAVKALRDLDKGAEEGGRRDGHEAEVARSESTVGKVGGEASDVGLMGTEGVAGGDTARDGESADGVGVDEAAAEAAGHETHRVAQVEFDKGVDGGGALRRAIGEHIDAEEAAVDAAEDVPERVGDGCAKAVEKGAVEDVGQLPTERVGVAEEGATEGAAGVGVEDGKAGVGDAAVSVAVELQGEVCRFV